MKSLNFVSSIISRPIQSGFALVIHYPPFLTFTATISKCRPEVSRCEACLFLLDTILPLRVTFTAIFKEVNSKHSFRRFQFPNDQIVLVHDQSINANLLCPNTFQNIDFHVDQRLKMAVIVKYELKFISKLISLARD
jgi:hypothetical protein